MDDWQQDDISLYTLNQICPEFDENADLSNYDLNSPPDPFNDNFQSKKFKFKPVVAAQNQRFDTQANFNQSHGGSEYSFNTAIKAMPNQFNQQHGNYQTNGYNKPLQLQSPPKVLNKNQGSVPLSALGNQRYTKLFKFQYFNQMQSECFNDLYKSDRNITLSAPTGGGKTCVLEMAILRLLSKNYQNAKVVYIAPTKALCEERQKDWNDRFGRELNISCKSLTGDTPAREYEMVQKAQIIITTPEKWDSISRQWNDTHNLLKYLHLLLIDEIHTIKDGVRGATLEAVVTRMKSLSSMNHGKFPNLRIVAVSATIPNLIDFSHWLRDSNGQQAIVKIFGEEYRPVKLKTTVIGVPQSGNSFQFEENLKFKLGEILYAYSDEKPTLIFCSTRKSSVSAADYLVKDVGGKEPYVNFKNKITLANNSKKIKDNKLALFIANGIGYHHGGLELSDRDLVEKLFKNGDLMIICTTTTLAVGVNLPAHLVIIKGTTYYDFSNSSQMEYSDLDVLQMMGRAGRPQYDNEGKVVILTSKQMEAHYNQMEKEIIESSLHQSLIEHLNAEISLGNINSFESAMNWLKSTFLYVRIKINPSFYRLKNCNSEEAQLSAEKRLEAIFIKDLGLLCESQIVENSNNSIRSSEYGKIMAKSYMRFQSVDLMIKLKPKPTQADILTAIRFHADKTVLNALNKNDQIRFHLPGKVSNVWEKIYLLIQAYIANLNPSDFEKSQNLKNHNFSGEIFIIKKNATRICQGMVEIMIAKKDYLSIYNSIMISQAVHTGMWHYSSLKCKQVENVGPQLARAFSKGGIDSIQKLVEADQHKIEMLANRNPPFGKTIQQYANMFPLPHMTISKYSPLNGSKTRYVDFNVMIRPLRGNGNNQKKISFQFLAGTVSGKLLDTRRIASNQFSQQITFTLKFKIDDPKDDLVFSLLCLKVVGIDCSNQVSIENPQISRQISFGVISNDGSELWDGIDLSKYEDEVETKPLPNPKSKPSALTLLEIDPVSDPEPDLMNLNEQKPRLKSLAMSNQKIPKAPTLLIGNVPCNHKCKDKIKCRHICCKEGIPENTKRKRISDGTLDITNPPTKQIVTKVDSSSSLNFSDIDYDAVIEPEIITIRRVQEKSNENLIKVQTKPIQVPERKTVLHSTDDEPSLLTIIQEAEEKAMKKEIQKINLACMEDSQSDEEGFDHSSEIPSQESLDLMNDHHQGVSKTDEYVKDITRDSSSEIGKIQENEELVVSDEIKDDAYAIFADLF